MSDVTPRGRGGRLLLACILGFLAAMGPLCTDFYLPALPQMAGRFGAAASELQVSITACLLGLSLGQIFLGPFSDSCGRRKPLLASLALFIAASFLCSRSSSVPELAAWRFLQGLAGSGGVVLSRAVACDLYRGSELTKFFALLMLVNGIAPVFGPVIGGQILAFSSWEGIFVFLAACGACQFLLVLAGCPESLPVEKRTGGGVLASIAAMFMMLKDRTFLCYVLLQGFVMSGFFGYIAASPFVIQNVYGFSAQEYGLCFGAFGIGIMAFSQATGRMSPVRGDKALLRFGALLSFCMALVVLLAAAMRLPAWIMLPALFVFVSCIGITTTTGFSLAIASRREGAGGASGLLGVASFVFGAAAAPLVGLGGSGTAVPMGIDMVVSSAAVLVLCRMALGGARAQRR